MVRFDDTLPLVFTDRRGRPDPRFDEVEVVARSVDIETFAEAEDLTSGGLVLNKANAPKVRRLIEIVTGSLVSWNLEGPDGAVLPLTVESLGSQSKLLILGLINAWQDAQTGLSVPFEQPSSDGAPLAELPMESLAS